MEEQLILYRSLFRGRKDCYAQYWEKNGRSGYSPAYSLDWQEFKRHQATSGTMKDYEEKELLPLTDTVISKHLRGQMAVGVYPILPDNTSYFIVADFDGNTWLKDAQAYIDVCAELGLQMYLKRSKSGNGGHVWIFFSDAYPCYKSRAIALFVIAKALFRKYSKQDAMSHDVKGA